VLVRGLLDERVTAVPRLPLEDVPATATPEQLRVANRVAGDVPFYLQDWVAVVVLMAWGAIPVVIGYRRFRAADLG
jgi:ABC-2 type transport system permease protein